MNLDTAIEHMLDQLSDAMYEAHQTAPAIYESGGGQIQAREYEMFCSRCNVMQDDHRKVTDCPVGQLENKLRDIQSQETK